MQDEWSRYSCQITLPGFGKESQQKLQDAKVLIVGAGGLGCPAAQYLAASGIGTIGIADFDVISTSNLHRQILYSPEDLNLSKAWIACMKLQKQNPQISLVPITKKITSQNVMGIIKGYDIVVDGTDNFEAKYLLNDACVLTGKPFVHAAIYQYEGQVSVLNVLNEDGTRTANYRDLFPEVNAAQIPSCAEGGVIPTIAGIVGCIQANETIKWITGKGDLLAGKIFMLDSRTMQSRIIKTRATSTTIITRLPEAQHVNLVSANDLKNYIDKDLYELVDVRNADERRNDDIGGKHVPLSEIGTNSSLIEVDKPVIFYCETGRRSAEAARIAHRRFPDKDFFSLDGGLRAWKEITAKNLENI